MKATESLAEVVRTALPNVKAGSLRIWGEWFGKPYDNLHVIKSCDAEDRFVLFHFVDNEKLLVWMPRGWTIDQSTFRLVDADRVRWEWFYHGHPTAHSNLYFEDFVKSPQGIVVNTNIDYYKPRFKPNPSQPAVEIL